jgi:hypothetical protein
MRPSLEYIDTTGQRRRKVVPLTELLPQHREYLLKRAVSDVVAKQRGYRSVQDDAELRKLGFGREQVITPTLLIPIWGVGGTIVSYQHRPDKPRTKHKKIVKFENVWGSHAVLDVHPTTRRLVTDPRVAKIITEGVPKADAALSIGLHALALLGVWNWRGTNEAGGKIALADWESVALNDCTFYLAFDSDAMLKHSVYLALSRLRGFLESRRAIVKIVYLPAGPDEKVGLDDYIAQQRATGWRDAEIRAGLLALSSDELRRPPAGGQSPDDRRPAIEIRAGTLPAMVDAAETVLAANAERLRLFQHDGEIVHVIELTKQQAEAANAKDRVIRPAGAVMLHAPSATALLDVLDREIAWYGVNEKGAALRDCPKEIALRYLARVGEWKLPHLHGVIEAPLLRPDGTVLRAPGYDAATGLFLVSEADWPDVKHRPSKADAAAALGELAAPFDQFPFVGEADRSVLLACILTALQRRLIDHAPLFGFDAPTQRSGKSLQISAVGLIATGRVPAAAGTSTSEEEVRKAITAMLREGHLIVNLDNITHVLDSPSLARAITEDVYQDRLLSTNTTLRLSTRILLASTGNNLTFKGDLTSRALTCRIDAGVAHPEEREFRIADLKAYVLAHRTRLVAAALTVLSAWHAAGRPRQKLKPWGGFDRWSREIREPLLWLGHADPCETRDRIGADDPEAEYGAATLRLWRAAFGDDEVTTTDVITAAVKNVALKNQLLQVAQRKGEAGTLDAWRLLAWCRSIENKVMDDLQLVRRPTHTRRHSSPAWSVRSPGRGRTKFVK